MPPFPHLFALYYINYPLVTFPCRKVSARTAVYWPQISKQIEDIALSHALYVWITETQIRRDQ